MTHLYVLIYLPPSARNPVDVKVIRASHDIGVLEWERNEHMKENDTDRCDYSITETEVH